MNIVQELAPDIFPGDVFYYRSKKKLYGGVILFRQRDCQLIALSEEITKNPRSIQIADVLQTPLYTLAWFSDVEMLLRQRLHRIGTVSVTDDYSNRAGMLIDEQGKILLKNVGQRATWKHEYRAFSLRDAVVEDVLTVKYIPKTQR